MESSQNIRRYLTNFDSARTGNVLTDVLVVGSGVAGLTAAAEAAQYCDVVLVAKSSFADTTTYRAQGGVAAVSRADDSLEQHVKDTLTVGCGLNHPKAVDIACARGPDQIRDLIDRGLLFDRTGTALDLGLEGGHQIPRVYHAGGDATGKALSEFLSDKTSQLDSVRIFQDCYLIDLLTVEGVCVGAITHHETYGHQLIWAKRTILATGGYGTLFRESTNPPGTTGDGVAAAYRAGARLCDLEMLQFHPTTLYVAGSTRALISEAVRGEGAFLVDGNGHRFMQQYHSDGELAPRDVVSRAIVDRLRESGATCVYLDVRHLGLDRFSKRFPNITERCTEFGIDVGEDLIPVRPAAHFSIGGVVTDLEARTSVAGLYSCGEGSCTGLHGANRLASNSLLEGLVYGKIAGKNAGMESASDSLGPRSARVRNTNPPSPKTILDLADVAQSLRSLMWRNVGILRHGDRLTETVEIIDFWSRFVLDKTFDEPAGWEVQNMLILARLVALSALKRTESRGVHFRTDCPDTSSSQECHYAFTWQDNRAIEETLNLDMRPTT